jgi:hypothetical protein
MNALAREMARLLWWYLLWVMRRPWMKRLQNGWLKLVPPKQREKADAIQKKQNRWALKYGLPTLQVAMNFVIASVALTLVYLIIVNLNEAGTFHVPQKSDATVAQAQ